MPHKLQLLNLGKANIRILHYTWIAFFLSFVVWLGLGPMMPFIKEAMQLSEQQAKVLLILNVAMTIPARIIVGMLVDKLGPRIMYTGILVSGGLISIAFAWANSYEQLALLRFLSGFIGAGFVVGIRMIGEWFPARQNGLAQGIYGGWGNFGSAGAAMTLPFIAAHFSSDHGWRIAMTIASLVAIGYGLAYYRLVRDTPKGSTYFKPKKTGAMEVASYRDMYFYIVMNIPLFLALALLTWKLSPAQLNLLGHASCTTIYLVLTGLYLINTWKIWHHNAAAFKESSLHRPQYRFKQVAILDWAYFVTFGIELAMVSLLAMFYIAWFELPMVTAALLAGIYPFLNLVARPAGGWISDRIGRRPTLLIVFSGLSASFILLSQADRSWPLIGVIGITLLAGLFSKAGSGAIYAMAPLIQRRMTGQIAGMIGAYGNVGAVIFLTINSLTDYHYFFIFVASVASMVLLLILLFLEEPKGQMTEVLPDGTVQLIDVS